MSLGAGQGWHIGVMSIPRDQHGHVPCRAAHFRRAVPRGPALGMSLAGLKFRGTCPSPRASDGHIGVMSIRSGPALGHVRSAGVRGTGRAAPAVYHRRADDARTWPVCADQHWACPLAGVKPAGACPWSLARDGHVGVMSIASGPALDMSLEGRIPAGLCPSARARDGHIGIMSIASAPTLGMSRVGNGVSPTPGKAHVRGARESLRHMSPPRGPRMGMSRGAAAPPPPTRACPPPSAALSRTSINLRGRIDSRATGQAWARSALV